MEKIESQRSEKVCVITEGEVRGGQCPSRQALDEMRMDASLCDAVLRVEEVDIRVHKVILAAHSQFFRALFVRWNSLGQSVYNIPGVSPDIMDLIIRFIYIRSIQVPVNKMESLLSVAVYLLVEDLVRLCCKFLQEHLSPENCLRIWKLADILSCYELRDKAYKYTLHHFEDVVSLQSESFLDLSIQDLGDLLENDELHVKNERTVFQAVEMWIRHDPGTRKQHTVNLLQKVRLALVDMAYIQEYILKNEFVNSVWECKLIIARACRAINVLKMADPHTRLSNPLTRPRLPHSVLFAIGGTSAMTTVETYDSSLDSWRCISQVEQRSVAGHSTVFLNGLVYIIGGIDHGRCLNSTWTFDPVDKTCKEVASMHSRRNYVSVVVLDGFIYAMGGYNGTIRLNTAERYDPRSDQWNFIPPMHEQRSDASAATLDGKIYICGGCSADETHLTAEVYDPRTNQWTMIEPMHTRRSGLGVAVLNNKVFAIGGFDGVSSLNSIEAYDPQTGSWSILSPMSHRRRNFGIEVMDDRIYVIGGNSRDGPNSECEYYDVDKDEWVKIQNMNVSRSGVSCCVISGLPNITDYTMDRSQI